MARCQDLSLDESETVPRSADRCVLGAPVVSNNECDGAKEGRMRPNRRRHIYLYRTNNESVTCLLSLVPIFQPSEISLGFNIFACHTSMNGPHPKAAM